MHNAEKLGQTKCVCKIFSQGPFEERRIFFHREPRNAVKYNVAWRVAEGVAMRVAVDPYAIQKEVKFGSQKEMGHGSCLESNSLSGVLYVCAPMDYQGPIIGNPNRIDYLETNTKMQIQDIFFSS